MEIEHFIILIKEHPNIEENSTILAYMHGCYCLYLDKAKIFDFSDNENLFFFSIVPNALWKARKTCWNETIAVVYSDMIRLAEKIHFPKKSIDSLIYPIKMEHDLEPRMLTAGKCCDYRLLKKENILDENVGNVGELIMQLFNLHFFENVLNCKQLNVDQMNALMEVFMNIANYLKNDVAFSLFKLLYRSSFQMLKNISFNFEITYFLRFYSMFFCLCDHQDDIVNIFGKLFRSSSKKSEKILCLNALEMIYNLVDSKYNMIIKRIIFDEYISNCCLEITPEIFKFMIEIDTKIPFTIDDINILFSNCHRLSNSCEDFIFNVITKIKIESFLQSLTISLILNSNIIFPKIYLYLLKNLPDQMIASEILNRILEYYNLDIYIDYPDFQITNNIFDLIQEKINFDDHEIKIFELAGFLLNFPNLELVQHFIYRLTMMKLDEPKIEYIIDKFFIKIPYSTKNLLNSLINGIIDSIDNNNGLINSSIIIIFNKYISDLKRIQKRTFQKLLSLNYSSLNSIILNIISKIIFFSKNRKPFKYLILKIIDENVNPKNSYLIVDCIFDIIEGEPFQNVSRICGSIVNNLQNCTKNKSITYLLYWIIQFEIDFYNVKNDFCFEQNFEVNYEQKVEKMNVCFYPYHSIRYLYNEVALKISRDLNSFDLYDQNFKLLKITEPLTSLQFDKFSIIKLNVKLRDKINMKIKIIKPFFLKSLEDEKLQSIIYNNVHVYTNEGEVLLQILSIVDKSFLHNLNLQFQNTDKKYLILNYHRYKMKYLFLFILYSFLNNKTEFINDYLESCIYAISNNTFGNIDVAIFCNILSNLVKKIDPSLLLIKKCLIDSKYMILRKTFLNLITDKIPNADILKLLHLTIKNKNRSNTTEFFSYLKQRKIPSSDLEPFFLNLNSYEYNHPGKIDQTFIGLLQNIQSNQRILDLVFNRVFSPVIIENQEIPFCRSYESRSEALIYLIKNGDGLRIQKLAESIELFNNEKIKISNNLKIICGNYISNSFISSFLQQVAYNNSLLQYLIKMYGHDNFIDDLLQLLIELRYSIKGNSSLNSLLQHEKFMKILSMQPQKMIINFFNLINDGQKSFKSLFYFMIVNVSEKDTFFDLKFFKKKFKRLPECIILFLNRNCNELFNFPFFFEIGEKYHLKSFIIHKPCENGVNYTSFQLNKQKWIKTDFQSSEYFDISTILQSCTKFTDLLIYQRYDLESKEINITKKLQENINIKNKENWPIFVFSNYSSFDILGLSPLANQIAFRLLYSIGLTDKHFLKHFIQKIKESITENSKLIHEFLEYSFDLGIENIANHLNETAKYFSSLFSLTLEMEYIDKLFYAFKECKTSNQLNFFIELVYSFRWQFEENPKLILLSLNSLTSNISKMMLKNENLVEILNYISSILQKNQLNLEFSKIKEFLFSEHFQQVWNDVIPRSEKYSELIKNISALPSNNLLNEVNIQEINNEVFNLINNILLPSLFSNDDYVRETSKKTIFLLLPQPNNEIQKYVQKRFINLSIKFPSVICHSYIAQLIIFYIKNVEHIIPKAVENCDCYFEIVERLCFISPFLVSNYLSKFFHLLKLSDDEVVNEWILMIIHHLIIIEDKPIEKLSIESIGQLLNMKFGTIYGINILAILGEKANNSILSSSCVEECFKSFYDDHTDLLVNLIKNGLKVGDLDLNFPPKDLLNLKLANAIWKNQFELRNKLWKFIKSTIDSLAQPMILYESSPLISQSLEYLSSFDYIEEEKKEPIEIEIMLPIQNIDEKKKKSKKRNFKEN